MSNVQPTVAVAQDPQVDAGFVKVFNAVDEVGASLGGKWAKVARYVIKHNLSREIVLASLKSMGKKYETAQSIATRVMDMVKPENQWKLDKLESGELSVRDARSATIKLADDGKTIIRTPVAARPASVRLADFLQSAANVAVTEGMGLEAFLFQAESAFNVSSSIKASKGSKPATTTESANIAGN
jgi:hypothetical protein